MQADVGSGCGERIQCRGRPEDLSVSSNERPRPRPCQKAPATALPSTDRGDQAARMCRDQRAADKKAVASVEPGQQRGWLS